MPVIGVDADVARRELEEVVKSPGFVRNERLAHFLRFLIERHLEGRDHELKESVLGTEVFGRKPDYSPKSDPIVRTEARRLRDRLRQYYVGAGANDAVRIELPKGGYVPVVRCFEVEAAMLAPRPADARSRFGKWCSLNFALVALTIVLALAALARFGSIDRLGPKANSESYDLSMRARAFEALPGLSGIESSLDLFHQVIARDASFAPAYAGIAAGYAARSGFDGFDAVQRADMFAQGWAAAARALQLDPRLADAYDGLAMMQARAAQWGLAERSFGRALELAPRDVLWRDHFAMFYLLPLGRLDEAIRQLRNAEELDPLSLQTHSLLASALRSAGRFDEALFHCQKAAANDQQRSGCWADNLLRQGRAEEAVRIQEAVWSGHLMEPGAQALGVVYAKAGRRKDAERIAGMLPRLASKAQIFASLGDKDRTLELLDQMAAMGPARIGRDFLIAQSFAFLRGDPRLAALRKKVGLPK